MSEIEAPQSIRVKFGQHEALYEPPDFVSVELNGLLSDAEAVAVLQWLDGIRAQTGPLVVRYDVRGLERLPRITRDFPRQSNAANYYRAMAVVGASFTLRVALTLLLNAVRLLNRDQARFEFEFFSSTEVAREWLKKFETR